MKASYDNDPSMLSPADRLEAVLAAERDIARIQARQARMIAAIIDDPCTGAVAPRLDKDYAREELRAALGESAVCVNNRVENACALVHRLPATLDAVESGGLSMRHARLLTDAITNLTDTGAAKLEATCVPFAAGRSLAAFARKVRREALALDTRSMEQQLADALARRRVWVSPDVDGTATFGAVLAADGAQALMTALDVLADHCPADEPRSKDQRRADALVQLGIDALHRYRVCPTCRGDIPHGDRGTRQDAEGNTERATLPRWHGMRPTVQVSVALSTLLGLDDQPAELDRHGPIPAALARRLAADPTGTWRRMVTDAQGRLIDYGRTGYEPPADLRDHVIARDRTCRFPGCTRPACRCELDHIVGWADGGETNADNMHALCSRHHHLKHDTDWTVTREPDGTTVWTSPTRNRYAVEAAGYPVDRTSHTT